MHQELLAIIDPQTELVIKHILNVICPIIMGLAGGLAVILCIRLGIKIHFSPEKKGEHLRNATWSFIGLLIVFLAGLIGTILVNTLMTIAQS